MRRPPRSGPAARWRAAWARDAWVRPFFFRYRRALALSLVLGVGAAAFAAALMFASGHLMSAAAERPAEGVFALLGAVGLVQVFGVGKPFLSYFERLRAHDWVLRMTSALRLRLYRAVERDALFWTAARRTGDVLGLLAQDIGHVQDLYLRTVFPLVVGWALWLLASLLLGLFTPLFGLFMLLELGVVTLLLPLVSVLVNGARRMRAKAARNDLYAGAVDDVFGSADWVCSGRSDGRLRTAMDGFDRVDADEARAARFDRRRDLVAQLVMGAAAAAVLVWAAARFGPAAGDLGAGMGDMGRPADWIAAFVLGFFPLIEAFAPLSGAAEDAGGHLDSVERLNAMDGRPAGPGPEGSPAGSAGAQGEAPAAPRAPAAPAVLLEGVRFAYPGEGRDVLRGLDLAVAPGERVAVLGPSGAGKSTLLGLVRGDLAPAAGRVLLCGEDPAALGDAVCRRVAVVQQDTYLFNATLLDNLRVGDPGASEERAARALADVGLGGLLRRLPQGLATMVDEAGLRFSGGERHRVALARALLSDAPVVLLDEPTVGLDPATEADLLATVLRVLEGRTVVMVTHHLLGVGAMDRVVFVEGGRVVLEGAPAELERTSERYRRLLAFDRGL